MTPSVFRVDDMRPVLVRVDPLPEEILERAA